MANEVKVAWIGFLGATAGALIGVAGTLGGQSLFRPDPNPVQTVDRLAWDAALQWNSMITLIVGEFVSSSHLYEQYMAEELGCSIDELRKTIETVGEDRVLAAHQAACTRLDARGHRIAREEGVDPRNMIPLLRQEFSGVDAVFEGSSMPVGDLLSLGRPMLEDIQAAMLAAVRQGERPLATEGVTQALERYNQRGRSISAALYKHLDAEIR